VVTPAATHLIVLQASSFDVYACARAVAASMAPGARALQASTRIATIAPLALRARREADSPAAEAARLSWTLWRHSLRRLGRTRTVVVCEGDF
jgi:hypothetical protein